MSNDRIKKLLTQLQGELSATKVDDETRELLQQLETDIEDLLDASTETSSPEMALEGARRLDSDFAARYPTAERVVREIVDTLAKMGV